jgi:hypothetical protein
VQEVLVTKYEPQLAPYQVSIDVKEDDASRLNDPELVAAPLKSYAEFQEDESEYLKTRVFIGSFH